MAEIYTAPRVVRRVKPRKESFDWASLVGDLLGSGIGAYTSLNIADKQGATARDIANINARSNREMIEAQTEQLMKMFNLGEEDRKATRDLVAAQAEQMRSSQANQMEILNASNAAQAALADKNNQATRDTIAAQTEQLLKVFEAQNPPELRSAQVDAIKQGVESSRIGNQTNAALLQQIIESQGVGRREASLGRNLDIIESQKLEAGTNAEIAAAMEQATAASTLPVLERAMEKGEVPLTGEGALGPLFDVSPTIQGFTALKAEAMAGKNPISKMNALQGIEAMRASAEDARKARIHPFARAANSMFGIGPGAELDALIDEMDNFLGSSAAYNVRQSGTRASMPGPVHRVQAELPFAAQKRNAAIRAYSDPSAPIAPENYRPMSPIQPASFDGAPFGPPRSLAPQSPTIQEVHTPLDPNAGAMGPMNDIGRMMAMRRLEELGLVA